MSCGDNKNSVHKMKYIHEDERIVVAFCERCKIRVYIRKYLDRPEPKYGIYFKRDTLQPGTNLYYREYPEKMNVSFTRLHVG